MRNGHTQFASLRALRLAIAALMLVGAASGGARAQSNATPLYSPIRRRRRSRFDRVEGIPVEMRERLRRVVKLPNLRQPAGDLIWRHADALRCTVGLEHTALVASLAGADQLPRPGHLDLCDSMLADLEHAHPHAQRWRRGVGDERGQTVHIASLRLLHAGDLAVVLDAEIEVAALGEGWRCNQQRSVCHGSATSHRMSTTMPPQCHSSLRKRRSAKEIIHDIARALATQMAEAERAERAPL